MSFISNALGGLIKGLSGAGYNAGQVQNYYGDAMKQLLDSTGSPAATAFGKQEETALQPLFQDQIRDLTAQEAATGTLNSGAAKADFNDLNRNQLTALAGAISPLYSSAIGAYGNLAGAGAGAASNAYGQSLQDFYGALRGTGTGGNPYGG